MTSRPLRSRIAAAAALALALTLGIAVPSQADDAQPIVATTQSPGYSEVGSWSTARDPSYDGVRPRFTRTAGDTATWVLTVPEAGRYGVETYYTGSVDNGKRVRYAWTGQEGEPVVVDQTANGSRWNRLGTVELEAGAELALTVTASDGSAVTAPSLGAITRADAVRLVPLGPACGSVTAPVERSSAPTQVFDGYRLVQHGTVVRVQADDWAWELDRDRARYALKSGDELVARAHTDTGLLLGGDPAELCAAVAATLVGADADGPTFEVLFSDGRTADLEVTVHADRVTLRLAPRDDRPAYLRGQLAGGQAPAYGLGDLGGWSGDLDVYGTKALDYYAQNADGTTEQRFVSNFTVFPDRRFAQVAFWDGSQAIQIDDDATLLGANAATALDIDYFFGDMETIYAAYRDARHDAGYVDARPDYTFFGVGYESYGALGYNTNQATITASVAEYLERAFPISWAVTGSGFWPYVGTQQGTTSSFGMWGEKYPDPAAYKRFFADNDIALILGLRQSFPALPADGGTYDPAKDGPWVTEAIEKGYLFADADGSPRTFSTISFPAGRVYLLDPENPEAVAWFVENSRAWEADGFKEDHMFNATANGFPRNDLVNPVNEALAEDGNLVMVRNSAYSVGGSILRINDTDYNHGPADRDRTAINGLAYAASGQPNFYPDIVGGRMMPDLATNADKQRFLARNAMFAAMSPSMSFGNEPWVMSDASLVAATVKAAQWHAEYQPYLYSEAIASFESGYPSTATPLPIAFPDDPATYGLVSAEAKQYEWMIGPSLLVAPLYGSDATTATARDVYLPEGEWMDIETGERFTGPVTLEDREQPFGKIPAFVGGSGIVVHQVGDAVHAQVFPVAPAGAEYRYTAADGESTASITVEADPDAGEVRVIDDAGGAVPHTVDPFTGAIDFAVQPGADYRVVSA